MPQNLSRSSGMGQRTEKMTLVQQGSGSFARETLAISTHGLGSFFFCGVGDWVHLMKPPVA